MGILQIIFSLACIFLGIVLLCLGVIYLERKAPSEEYDERQKAMRGNAYRLSFFVGMIYYLVVTVILIRAVDGEKTVEPYLLLYFGMILQIMVLHTYCLLTHSALPLSEKPVTTIVCYILSGLIQLLYVFEKLDAFPLPFVGKETSGWIHLTTGILVLFLALMHLIRLLWKEKE